MVLRGRLEVGDWLVEPQLNQLSRGERLVRLEPRSMEVLVHLAAHPQEVLDKQAIIEAVWGEAFVTDEVLTHAVWELRKALGDDARRPRYIQTIPKRGYRLIAPVQREAVPPEAGREAPAAAAPRERSRGARTLLPVAGLLLLVLAAPTAYWLGRERSPPAGPHRLVVLPLESLGSAGRDLFAAGLTEELTRRLVAHQGLEVVSPAEVGRYAGRPLARLREELGGDYLLRGEIYWLAPGEQPARIALELVQLADGVVVWAAAYHPGERPGGTRALLQAASVTTDQIVEGIGLALGISPPPTEAESAYRLGLDLESHPDYEQRVKENAADLFERAVELDPGYAAAWAALARVHSVIFFNSDPAAARADRAEAALARALQLAPGEPVVRLADAFVRYRVRQDYDQARALFRSLVAELPGDPEALKGLGYVERRRGRPRQALEPLTAALRLEPADPALCADVARTYRAIRDFDRAAQHFDRAIALAPHSRDLRAESAYNLLMRTGSVAEAKRRMSQHPLDRDPEMLFYWLPLDLYDRQYQAAVLRYASLQGSREPIDKVHNPWLAALALQRLGQEEQARHLVEENRLYLEELLSRGQGPPLYRAYLALSHAFLGEAEEAREQIRLAVGERTDAFDGPRLLEIQAMLHVLLGENAEAVALLEELLSREYFDALTVTQLRLDPIWDPLRSEAGFQRLLEEAPRPPLETAA